jgi:hypothetical protein
MHDGHLPAKRTGLLWSWASLCLLLASVALVAFGIVEAARFAVANLALIAGPLRTRSVWEILGLFVIARLFTFNFSHPLVRPARSVLLWWMIGTACAALAQHVVREVNPSESSLRQLDENWLAVRERLEFILKYNLLALFVAGGWLLALKHARPFAGSFRLGTKALEWASAVLMILTAATSFSFFTSYSADQFATQAFDKRRQEIMVVLRETEGRVAANLAREQIVKEIEADKPAAARALGSALEDIVRARAATSCREGDASCIAAIKAFSLDGKGAVAADLQAVVKASVADAKEHLGIPASQGRRDLRLPEEFSRPPTSVNELHAQWAAAERSRRELDKVRSEESSSKARLQEARLEVVKALASVVGGSLLSILDLASLTQIIGSFAEAYYDRCTGALADAGRLPRAGALWQFTREAINRSLQQEKTDVRPGPIGTPPDFPPRIPPGGEPDVRARGLAIEPRLPPR